jgi:hypothetical protein
MPTDHKVGLPASTWAYSRSQRTAIGCGVLGPTNLWGNIAISLMSYTSIVVMTFVAGIVFIKFSKPKGKFLFGDKILMTPMRHTNNRCLVFRVANGRACSRKYEDAAHIMYHVGSHCTAVTKKMDPTNSAYKMEHMELKLHNGTLPFMECALTFWHVR